MIVRKPPMGWNSWNTFGANINEKVVMETADAIVEKGLKAAGNLLLDAHWLGFAEMFGLMLFAIVLYPALFQWVEGRKSKS